MNAQKINKEEAACNGLMISPEEERCKMHFSTTKRLLQQIRDEAWNKAIKYQFDPIIGKMHEEYLKALNLIIKEIR